ncbi:MAG: tRNA (adenosine(37)-N6)-dimethylallyltransferase MiaA [Bacteroidales bacterium]|nr:tRNA (adenosine(37)-N6)-dimethylallyltransferase MiaA [Bacteroidales bacterium]MDY6427582.1 tRNA (adenosine(37)-N6)-dimethylallyltransferase MiaA [Bacteroidales bacterium]
MKTLYVLLGPTGVGKTALSIDIAKKLDTPVISADSRQIYRGIPIGTAAPTLEQLSEVKHYFIATKELDEYYSAGQYELDALQVIEEQFSRGDNALLVGGSMMYIDAVCQGLDDVPRVDEETRSYVTELYKTQGLDKITSMLRLLDPEWYDRVDLKNPKRVMHAVEVSLFAGKPYSSILTQSKKERPFSIIKIGLNRERDELYDNINRRVEQMIADGLEAEARSVCHLRHLNSLNTVGFKEMFAYFDGSITFDEAVEQIKRNTRRYAKKQLTWFSRDSSIRWFHPNNLSSSLSLP